MYMSNGARMDKQIRCIRKAYFKSKYLISAHAGIVAVRRHVHRHIMEDRRFDSVVLYVWIVVITICYFLTIKYSGTPDKSNTLISRNKCRSVTKTLIAQQKNYRELELIGKSK